MAGKRKETHVERPPDSDAPDVPGRADRQPSNVAAEEREIDQILADSFPASDAPPWTLGVAEAPADESRTKNRDRRHRR
jgi:hypothetical protein